MSLDLDTRQRAMLQEMGVHVWWPEAAQPLAPQGAPESAERATKKVAVSAIPTVATGRKALETQPEVKALTTADGLAALDWQALAQTIAACQACRLCEGRRAPVFAQADAPRRADWLVVGEPPDDAEERAGTPFAEQAGQLLDNMLKALGLSRRSADDAISGAVAATKLAYVTNVVKCRPAAARNPDLQELATCEQYLRQEVERVQPKVILAMGRFAATTLLQDSVQQVATTPLGQLRGQVYHYQGIAVIVTYHPNSLLRSPQHKARAWLDLCLAQEARRRGG